MPTVRATNPQVPARLGARMRPVTATVTIPAPRAEVFAFVADSTNDPAWCPLVPEVTQVEGEGPAEGARYRFIQRTGKKSQIEGTIDLKRYDAPSFIEWHVEDAIRTYQIEMMFEEVEGGTLVRQTSHPKFKGLWGLLLTRARIQRMMNTQFRRLARQFEADAIVAAAQPVTANA